MLMVRINSIETVKQFVNAACECECDISLQSGRYVIDGKSIMGVFSLDLTKPIGLIIEADDEETKNFALEKMKPFIIDDVE